MSMRKVSILICLIIKEIIYLYMSHLMQFVKCNYTIFSKSNCVFPLHHLISLICAY